MELLIINGKRLFAVFSYKMFGVAVTVATTDVYFVFIMA